MKNGFTLAEVLLTLAIIGAVEALTIPAVVTKVTKDHYIVGLKKAYSTFKTVERETITEHSPMENLAWINTIAHFEKYFFPHLDILKNCSAAEEDVFAMPLHFRNYFRVDVNGLNGPNRNGRNLFNLCSGQILAEGKIDY